MEILVFCLLFWGAISFHWTRIGGTALSLGLSGLVIVFALPYRAYHAYLGGEMDTALLTVGIGVVLGLIWRMAAEASLLWLYRHMQSGDLWRPWNAP
jgi:hypothetical protein